VAEPAIYVGKQSSFNGALYQFLKVELRLGLTRASIANTSYFVHRRFRNQADARKAYDAVVHALGRACNGNQSPLTVEQFDEVQGKLTKLRQELQKLGEPI
jgi:hypothetical protein